LQLELQTRLIARVDRSLNDDEDDSSSEEDDIDLLGLMALEASFDQRYLFRSKYRSGRKKDVVFHDDLLDDTNTTQVEAPWLSDTEFLHKYHVTRQSFQKLEDKIKDHPIFHKEGRRGRAQAPVSHQLMVFLKYLGTEGSGASNTNQRHTFGVAYGSAQKYRQRVTIAICSLKHEYISWPNEEEREAIGKEIGTQFHFPHCVGIADGTLFPLAFEPQSDDAPDYSGRKYGYSISTMVICDHRRRIRHYLSGFPGSAHDNRVMKATVLSMTPGQYFSPRQYVVGDSAFENQWFMVSAYKKLPGQSLQPYQEEFNKILAKLRIASEHCIGILKGRFPWLRSIRLVITDDKKSLKRILRLIEATVILHNMLIEFGEEEKDDWIDEDDISDIDEYYDSDDEINRAVPLGAYKDERRRRLVRYFEDCYLIKSLPNNL
jgi:hypothetical protein